MEFLVNDLSIHGQFQELGSFRIAIDRVMRIRGLAHQFGRDLYCHRNVAHAQVTSTLSMPAAIGALDINERRALMQWLTRHGPFWEDNRVHGPNDYLECNGGIVTDSAVGEAAYCCAQGLERHLVSLIPSAWDFSPVPVTWVKDQVTRDAVSVLNHWDPDEMEALLQRAQTPIASWEQLAAVATSRFPRLTFSHEAFDSLLGHPFVQGAAQRILALFDTLHRIRSLVDDQGQRTPDGHRLYQNHFTGAKAWFSDSSDSEKRDFRDGLTFRHPTLDGKYLFCGWHGKVKTPQLRFHFTWPVGTDEPLFVVYVGPKITKR